MSTAADAAPSNDRPRLTAEQAAPIAVRGASVALSAGAGCGKTTVLTERFLRAVDPAFDERRSLAEMVALTFTEKAARELRQRIRRACVDRLKVSEPDQAPFWRATLRGLEAAPVSTFHEYCGGLLRRHAVAAGVDPDFEVLDDVLAGAVLDDALGRCVRRWLAGADTPAGADLIELAVEFGLQRVRESLADLVRRRGAAPAQTAGESAEQLIARWERVWDREVCTGVLRGLMWAAAPCAELLAANACRHAVGEERRLAVLDLLSNLQESADPAEALDALAAAARVQGGGTAKHWESAEIFEQVKTRYESLRHAIKSIRKLFDRDPAATLLAAEHGLRFARLAAEARQAYDAAKRARGGLDFDDLLLQTRALLNRHAGAVRDDPDRPVAFILVDEFQDTDPVQSDILYALTGDGFATGRLFVVGDFKQSIYRFRGARPELFREYREGFPTAGRLDLSENFRATTGLIDFVNALFHQAFPGEEPRLLPGPGATPAGTGPAVSLVWPAEPVEDGDAKPSAHALRQVEARWLARVVRARLDAGWPVRDRKTRAVRQAHAGDVAFLFRAMTDVAPYEQALTEEGLDFHVVGGSAFYAQQEVQDLVNVLSAVEDPCDAVSLAGALRGPFFGLSDDGLCWLGASAGGDLGRRLRVVEEVEGLSDQDRGRAVRARALLDGWRAVKNDVPIAALVDRVLDESGYEAALPGEFLGDRKRANARKLVRLARRFDAQGGFTLAHLVDRLRRDLREPPREGQAATTDEEGTSVRLMSVHQAKGLEFPIVVVPDLNRRSDPARQAVAFDPDLGVIVRPAKAVGSGSDDEESGSGQSLGWDVFRTREKRADEDESVRLFYVATTRARDALILSAGGGPNTNPQSPALRLLAGRFDRAGGACLAELPAGWATPEVEVIEECPPPAAGARPRPRRESPKRVARVIADAAPSGPVTLPAEPAIPPAPRLIDLDDMPGLSPPARRLGRLLRSVVADPAALPRGGLPEAARRAARRQVPRAGSDLVEEVVRRLEPWLAGRIGTFLARAGTLERDVAWVETCPGAATVVRGRTDFLARDGDGTWAVVTVGAPGTPPALERLRWVLSARAAAARGLAPIGPGWRIDLTGEGGLFGESAFDDAAAAAALRAAIAALAT